MEKTQEKKHFLSESIMVKGILRLKTTYELLITQTTPGVYFIITQTSCNSHTNEEITRNTITHAWNDLPDILISIEDANEVISKIIGHGSN
jgi:hypothetical protein